MGRKGGKKKVKDLPPPPPDDDYEGFVPASVRDETSDEEETFVQVQQEEEDKGEQIRRKKNAKKKKKILAQKMNDQAPLLSQQDLDRNKEKSQIEKLCAPQKLIIREIPPGADSLYASVADQCSVIADFKISAAELRTKAVKQVQRNPQKFTSFLEAPEEALRKQKEQVLRLNEQAQNGYGGPVEVMALSYSLKRPIVVITAEGTTQYGESDKPPLFISCHEKHHAFGKHYNSLVPLVPVPPESAEKSEATKDLEVVSEEPSAIEVPSPMPSPPEPEEMTEQDILGHLFKQVPLSRRPVVTDNKCSVPENPLSRFANSLEQTQKRLKVESSAEAMRIARGCYKLLHPLRRNAPRSPCGTRYTGDFAERIANLEREMYEYSDLAYQIIRSEQESSQQDPNNYVVDLHELYRYQAQEWVDDLLNRFAEPARGQPKYLTIITGVGHHSASGQSVLRGDLLRTLNSRNLKFKECNPGEIRLTLHHSK